MYDKNEFDEYSNYDDRDNHQNQSQNKAAPKMKSPNKEEFGMEKFFKNLFSKNKSNNENNK